MNNSSRNRNHPDHQNELQVLKTDLCNQVITDIQQVVSLYAHLFDLDFLSARKPDVPIQQALATLYQRTLKAFQQHNIPFDDHLHWIVPWRQALCFESLAELANEDISGLISSFHPKSHNALVAVFDHGLEKYMRWYPWHWFSDLVFLGAGGFSAVYEAKVNLLYDVPERGNLFGSHSRSVALKIVDDKILNEITVQSKAFLALLFHGMTVCESTGDLIMILTLAEEGNLNRQIELTAQTNMAQVADIVTRLALNLASLHDDIRMCHRNIHPENILSVDEDYFLVDYRFSTSIQESSKVTQSSMVHYGRVPYIAPEVREKGIYSEKSDVYSLGVIMWQLISGVIFPPSPDVLLGASHIYRIEWVPGVSRWYQELAMACLEPNPEHRPSAEEIGLIARKIAVSCQHQEPDQSWISYVVNRQAKTKSHIDKWLDHQDLKGTATASRVYTLDELPNTDALLNHVPFHCRPFDPDNISYQIESEKNEQI